MTINYFRVLMAFTLVGIIGCAAPSPSRSEGSTLMENSAGYQQIVNNLFSQIGAVNSKADKDRAAILAMQGEYYVAFNFEETVVVQPGYIRHPPKQAAAFETVVVVKDSPRSIVLQHLLVSQNGDVIKHWRQDWTATQSRGFAFTDDQHWISKAADKVPAPGVWTQCVYEVSDAPRYCGTGEWQHDDEASTWSSGDSWRPLPRREYTVRDDYNALRARNRHTITAQGWTHEQDNTKVARANGTVETVLVREFGFNDYQRIRGFDFSPAYTYWQATAVFWERVRNAWAEYFERDGHITLATAVHGLPVIEATFREAQAIQDGRALLSQDQTRALIGPWVNQDEVIGIAGSDTPPAKR